MSPTGIYIASSGKEPELLLSTKLCHFRYYASGSISYSANTGSYSQTVALSGKTYRGNQKDIYVVYITPTSASVGSLANTTYLNKKIQLGMALPINIQNSTTKQRLSTFDILTCKLLGDNTFASLEFQAVDTLNLHSSNPVTTTSISFNWELIVFSYG
jgi:hypothetical protein